MTDNTWPDLLRLRLWSYGLMAYRNV